MQANFTFNTPSNECYPGGKKSKAEKGPLMTSPYLGNRDKTF